MCHPSPLLFFEELYLEAQYWESSLYFLGNKLFKEFAIHHGVSFGSRQKSIQNFFLQRKLENDNFEKTNFVEAEVTWRNKRINTVN